MKVYEMVFSPTGGTRRVVDVLGNGLGDEVVVIDLCDRYASLDMISIRSEDVCVVGVPSYMGRVPRVALERIRRILGNGARVIPVVVYGNRAYEDTLLELKDTLEQQGFRCIAAVTAIAEHSIAREVASGRPNAQDIIELQEYSKKIRERLLEDTIRELPIPGHRPYKKAIDLPLVPSINTMCTKCGMCALKCPVGAISSTDPSKVDKHKCIACMRCISVCPTHARGLHPVVLMGTSKALQFVCREYLRNELII